MKKTIPANEIVSSGEIIIESSRSGMCEKPLKVFEHNKGASSVLVIFMLMVLASLGAFAITSANVSYKLSVRASNWNAMYYTLDARAEEYLSALDVMLVDAEGKALKFTSAVATALKKVEENIAIELVAELYDMPAAVHEAMIKKWLVDQAQGENIGNIMKMAYMYYAQLSLDLLDTEYPDIELTNDGDGIMAELIHTRLQIKSETPDFENCYLGITVLVKPPQYIANQLDDQMLITRDESIPRYFIDEWREYQIDEPMESDGTGLWDGFF